MGLSGTTSFSFGFQRGRAGSLQGWAGGVGGVVLGQEGEQPAQAVEAGVLAGIDQVGHAALAGMHAGAAELLGGHVLLGHLLDHLGPGEEHVGGLLHHHDEVGDGRRIDGAAGAGAEDQRDLRHHARVEHVAQEDVGVAGQRIDPFLDARPARVVDADERRADLGRHLHDLDDLLGVGLGQRAAEDGEVLGKDEDQPALDGAVAGDDAVGQGLVLLHVEIVAAVGDEHVEFLEAAGVEDLFDPFPGRVFAFFVLAGDAFLAAGQAGFFLARHQVEQFFIERHHASVLSFLFNIKIVTV